MADAVTDPNLIAQLEANAKKPVTDPDLISKLEANAWTPQMTPQEKALRQGQRPSYLGPDWGGFGQMSRLIEDPIGVRDEMVGAGQAVKKFVTSGGSLDEANKAYNDAVEYARAEKRIARERYGPVPEIVGGLGMMRPGMAPGIVNGVRTFITAPQPTLTLGERLLANAKGGAAFGATSGFAQGEGGFENRVGNAVGTAATDAAVAPVLGEVIPKVIAGGRNAISYTGRKVAEARNPQLGSDRDILDAMDDAGVTPSQLRTSVVPPRSANLAGRGFTDQDLADIVSRGLRGESPADIGRRYGLHESTVRRYVTAYQNNNPTPLNVMDLTDEMAGQGNAQAMTREARTAQIISRNGEAAQRIIDRQLDQPGRITNELAGQQFEGRVTQATNDLKSNADAAYESFYNEHPLASDQLGDLLEDPTFTNAVVMARRQARADIIRKNQIAARNGQAPQPVPSLDPQAQLFEPQVLDNIQRQLRLKSQGFANDPNEAAHARNLRDIFLDRIEDHFPSFRPIRQNYAEGLGDIEAMRAGEDMTTKIGADTRETLAGYRRMPPARQELFRLGFERKLTDLVRNSRDNAGAANQFATSGFRDLVNEMYPPDDAARLIRFLNREAITTRTKNNIFGNSNTGQTTFDLNAAMEGAHTAADLATGRVGRLLENSSNWLARKIAKDRATQTLQTLTETEPSAMLSNLDRLHQQAAASADRNNYLQQLRDRRQFSTERGVFAGNALEDLRGDNQQENRSAPTPPKPSTVRQLKDQIAPGARLRYSPEAGGLVLDQGR